MRATSLVLVLALVVALGMAAPAVGADSASISRDARGPQPTGDHDPLGGPPTPRLYILGQTTIFVVGIALLAVAAGLGAYTLLLVRRAPMRP
jgi:hypothetical protein